MRPPSGAALLLSRLGSYVSGEFAARLAPLGLTPAQVGILRVMAQDPGLSQQGLAERIGAVPSRVVKLLDELEDQGLVERRRSTTDRRHHELYLAPAAAPRLTEVRKVVGRHDADLVSSLTPAELAALLVLLGKLADAAGIGVAHPGYQTSRSSPPEVGP